MRAWTVAALALILASCDRGPGGEDVHERPIASGHYGSDGPSIDELARFPHGAQRKSMTIDREAGTVRIEYDRDGEHVVETWRIARSAFMTSE